MADSPDGASPDDVSRETPSGPDREVAERVFPSLALPRLERYADLLATEGVRRGLLGPREVPRLWDRHLINCGLLAPLVPDGATVVDLGSGAGLPGLVLALARADLTVTLLEPMERRVVFLEEAVRELAIGNVMVVRARAEQWQPPGGPGFDVVTARALAPLDRLLDLGLPLMAATGQLLAMKGSAVSGEIASAKVALERWSAHTEVLTSAVPGSSVTTVVRVVRDPVPAIGWRPATGRVRRRPGGSGRSTRRGGRRRDGV